MRLERGIGKDNVRLCKVDFRFRKFRTLQYIITRELGMKK